MVQNKAHGYRHQLGKKEHDRLKKCENVREMMLLSETWEGAVTARILYLHCIMNYGFKLLHPNEVTPPIDGGFFVGVFNDLRQHWC